MTLVVHTGSSIEGYAREQDFETLSKIDPFIDEIGKSVGFGPIIGILSKSCSLVKPSKPNPV